jgi:hypothetical protein
MRGDCGGDVRHREIEAPTFDEIACNNSAAVRRALGRLIEMQGPDGGRLILWRGEPGTGKSHALRALARAWAPWCSAHFIMDPDELLGRGGAYMFDVLTWQDGDDDRWRVLILEDAGELIAADARAVAGQALSRPRSRPPRPIAGLPRTGSSAASTGPPRWRSCSETTATTPPGQRTGRAEASASLGRSTQRPDCPRVIPAATSFIADLG